MQKYPSSSRASSALYNLGLLAERRKDTKKARDAYQRVVQRYPQSDEAALARDRLKALGR
jgi:TolA-binding protein